jgi:hypothetical protein
MPSLNHQRITVASPAADLRHDTTLFGRQEELYHLVRNLQRGRHTLITGEKGVGKTRLLLEAKWIFSGSVRRIDLSAEVMTHLRGQLGVRVSTEQYKILYIEHANPLGECLREMAELLYYSGDLRLAGDDERNDWLSVKKELAAYGSRKIQSALFEGITRSATPYLIFFESLDQISSSQQPFIETLLNISVICSTAARMKDTIQLRNLWASFSKIELEPLPEPVSIKLIDYFFDRYPLHVIDRDLYRREILKASNGNPFHMKNMLWHGSREKFVDSDEIRKLRRSEEGHYFNMGPIYILGVAMFTIFKIFSIGTDNREFYIYFSALGFVAYLIFRVFRAFFIFRPQKYR